MAALTPLLPEELDEYYHILKDNFPPNELKGKGALLLLTGRGIYDMWKYTEDGAVKGLALLLRAPGCRYALLDYLVMDEKNRGYGSRCLEALKEIYPAGIMLEAEALVEGLPEEELAIRRRRLAFYRRAGWTPYPFRTRIFGVVYLIHLWAEELPENGSEVCAWEMYHAYKEQIPRILFDKHVYIEGYTD